MPEEIKTALKDTYEDYVKPMMPMLIMMLVLLLIVGMSILFLGKNNSVEQDIEKILEAEATGITSS